MKKVRNGKKTTKDKLLEKAVTAYKNKDYETTAKYLNKLIKHTGESKYYWIGYISCTYMTMDMIVDRGKS